MLHILLGLLKIIGIIIAVIIGIVLLVICVVLLAAFRYNVSASADGDVKSLTAQVKFSWLFHLISGFVTYQNEKLDWQIKIAWKKMNVPKEYLEEFSDEVQEEVQLEVQQEVQQLTNQEVVPQDEVQQHEPEEPRVMEAADSKKQSKKQTKKRTKKDKTKKKESVLQKIQCSIRKISDKIKEIKAIKDKVVSFIQAEVHQKAFQKLLKELLRMLKKLKPKKLKANVEFGFDDPYTTGSALAYLSMLYPFYGDNINIKPRFEETVLRGDIYLKGRIRIAYITNMGIRLILNKNIRLTIKDIMKLVAKK